MPRRLPKPVRVLLGILGMAAFVVVVGAVLVHNAGEWGVPYFSFTSPRGSPCKNTLTGYVCQPLNLADVEYWADINLPNSTVVQQGTYVSTHDYQITATLRVPPAAAATAMKALNTAFGRCQPGHPSPLDAPKLKTSCVLSNDDTVTSSGDASSRLYLIGTGIAADGSRPIVMSIKSR